MCSPLSTLSIKAMGSPQFTTQRLVSFSLSKPNAPFASASIVSRTRIISCGGYEIPFLVLYPFTTALAAFNIAP